MKLRFYRYRVDENYKPVGYPIYTVFEASTEVLMNAKIRAEQNRNDMTQYTPYYFDSVVSV